MKRSFGDIPKVPEDQFKAVVRALLSTPPMPMADIARKRGKRKPATAKTTKRG